MSLLGPSRPGSQASMSKSMLNTSRPETPLHEDTTLGITVLPSNGEAEHSMKVFIQEHITSILHPMAERVTELGKDLKKVTDDLENNILLAERNEENISNHDQKLILLNSGLNRLTDDLTQSRKDISDVMDRQVTMDGELDSTKVNLSKTEGNVIASNDAIHELRRLLEDIDGRARQAALSVSEINIQQSSFIDRLNDLRNAGDGLSERHMSLVTQLQQLRVSDENTRTVIKKNIASFEKTRKDDQRSFMLVDGRLKSLEELLLDCNGTVQKHNKNITTLTTDMKHLAAEIGEILGVQQGMNQKDEQGGQGGESDGRRNSAVTHAEKLSTRICRLEEAITGVNKTLASEKDFALKRHKELEDISKKTVSDIKDTNLILDGCQKQTRILDERALRSETRIAHEETKLDNCQKQADKLENDLRIASVSLRDTIAEVEFQKHELTKTNGILSGTRQDLETTNGNVTELGAVFSEMQGAMVKIGTRLELAHEYFNGMSKGLQDTHKRVSSGLDGMIGPKTMSTRKVLPEIPGSRPGSEQPRTSPNSPVPR